MTEDTTIFQGSVSHIDWDGATASGTLQVLNWSLKCTFETGTVEMPVDGLQIQCDSGKKGLVWFSHPQHPDWTICTEERDILKQPPFHKNFPVHQQIQAIERQQDDWKRLKTTICFLLGFALVALTAMNLSGWVLNIVVNRMPASYELKIGADGAKQLEEHLKLVDAPGVTNLLKTNLIQLLTPKFAARYDPKVMVYKSYTPNAFVIPGGYFYISSGLLSLAETPEEIVGVLAHEAAHLKCHHGIRKLLAEQGHGFMFKWIFGDRKNLLSLVSAGADMLANQTYSRELECQADEQGWEMLLAANIDPRGEIEILKKLDAFENSSGKSDTDFKILRSHPITQERIQKLTKKWQKSPIQSGFVTLEKIEWEKTKAPQGLERLFEITQ